MARRSSCTHPEGRREDGTPLPNDRHDCAYVDARNALIPQAERLAAEAVGDAGPGGAWSREFHAAMNRLAVEHGLVRA